ncbi:hypothetical protein ACFL31_02155 [Candidatus Margulisiibacteriota bacterium]
MSGLICATDPATNTRYCSLPFTADTASADIRKEFPADGNAKVKTRYIINEGDDMVEITIDEGIPSPQMTITAPIRTVSDSPAFMNDTEIEAYVALSTLFVLLKNSGKSSEASVVRKRLEALWTKMVS